MQVWNVLHAARGNRGHKNDAKNRHLRIIAQLCRAISSQLRHISTIGKKLVKQQHLLHMSLQYGKLRPTNGWDQFGSLEHPSKFQLVSRLGRVTARYSSTGRQPNCSIEQRAPPIFGRQPSRWALAHILVVFLGFVLWETNVICCVLQHQNLLLLARRLCDRHCLFVCVFLC